MKMFSNKRGGNLRWVLAFAILGSALWIPSAWAGPKFVLTSPSFDNDDFMPAAFTCERDNQSPDLKWSGLPKKTQSLALVVEDKDSPFKDYTHWVIFNLFPTADGLSGSLAHLGVLPNGALQGLNDYGGIGWSGPCPPRGENHRYRFTLYALDIVLDLKPECKKDQLLSAIKKHILAKTSLTGRYKR